ncbi:MAG: aldose 1-epimerase family protein [Mycobacterium sp.]
MRPLTGDQFHLTRGPWRAVITELAAGLRSLSVNGVELTPSYPETTIAPLGAGIVLVPWPNRVRDGLWQLNGAAQQLDITEVSRGNASHGLLRNTPYRVAAQDAASVTLTAAINPQHGYPFLLDTSVRYELVNDGLRVTHRITNQTEAAAPVALGTHPFLQIEGVPTEQLTLTVNAASRYQVDERKVPTGQVPVDGDFDLRSGRLVGELDLDTTFGEVTTRDGVAATLSAPDGRTLSLLMDESFSYVQVFTPREYPLASGKGLAVAVEPMTAPGNAFNSGDGLRWLEPGETWTAVWGIRYED